MDVPMKIQWFPGHMTKTFRMIQKDINLIDGVVEIVDSRIPRSSRNPDFDGLFKNKPRIVMLNKSDIADENVNKLWKKHFEDEGAYCITCSGKSGAGINQFQSVVKTAFADKLERFKAKGMGGKKLRLMVVGVPNVGKSTVINRLAGSNVCKAADKPGVTRGKQWITIGGIYELIDTPGVLWHKFDDDEQGEYLAYCGSINDDILDKEHLASRLCTFLRNNYKELLEERYKLSEIDDKNGFEILEQIARKRGMLISGGELDTLRAAEMLLDEFRGGKIGRISFEKPQR